MISAPMAFCSSIDFSGVSNIKDPSCGDANCTPSYSIAIIKIIILQSFGTALAVKPSGIRRYPVIVEINSENLQLITRGSSS